MKKNLKHSILFILMAITILLVVVMSLAVSKPVPNINAAAFSTQKENNLKSGKWSGLGFVVGPADVETFDSWVDKLLANGFTDLRIIIPDYQNTTSVAASKAAVIRAIAKGANAIWGVTSNSGNNPAYAITATNWPTFRQAILDAASWAQANGVYEFQLGNEEEWHVDGTTMSIAQIITNIRGVSAEVKAIFTRGNISYSCGWAFTDEWITAGKGNIDLLASNFYKGGQYDAYSNDYLTRVDDLLTAFGVDGTYITEFGPSYTSLTNYSADEAVQAAGVAEMIDDIAASGITRAMFFKYESDEFGAMNWNGTYKLLWNQVILNNTEPATTVPATATSI